MQQERGAQGQGSDTSQEAFLGSFSRVPSGLDPIEVYSYFLKMSARVQQLEEQARRVSAPYLLDAAMREATEIRTQAAQAAERTYNEIVEAAQQEAQRIRAEAEQQASRIIEDGRASLADAQRQATALLDRTGEEAARVRREASEWTNHSEQELERLCVDFAQFLQRLVEHRKASGDTARWEAIQPPTAAAPSDQAAAPAEPPKATPQWAVPPPVAEPDSAATRDSADARPFDRAASPPPAPPGPPAERPAFTDDGASSGPAPAPPPGPSPRPAAEQVPPPPPSPPRPNKSSGQEDGGFRLPSWLDS